MGNKMIFELVQSGSRVFLQPNTTYNRTETQRTQNNRANIIEVEDEKTDIVEKLESNFAQIQELSNELYDSRKEIKSGLLFIGLLVTLTLAATFATLFAVIFQRKLRI